MSDIKKTYIESAIILDKAMAELSSSGISDLHREFLSLKCMSSIIQNDVCRELHNIVVNPTTGTSKLLALGPIVLKLFEAHHWYSTTGNKKLRELAKNRSMLDIINKKLKEMKLINPPVQQ